jgi:branched-chain amino acid aminotransferase
LEIHERVVKKNKPDPTFNYTFGKLFTDHMFVVDWDQHSGWGKPQIVPYGPFKIETTATVLHYGISAYEGISCVKNSETGVPQAFRAQENLKSFYDASYHLDMPLFDTNELLECLKRLVKMDTDWFPELDYPS